MNKKFWTGKKVFITGSTGLLGYWITKYLVEADADVTVLVRKKTPASLNNVFSHVKKINGTILDYDLILKTLQRQKTQTVFHLAAQTISPVANSNPRSTFETNIAGTWNILEACRNTAIENIIVSSSYTAYAEDEKMPYTEESRLGGIKPYAASKACADLIAQTYFESYNLPLCIARCGNLFGGADLLPRLVPRVIRSGLLNEELLIRSDGKFVRDFLYVEDGALATIQLAEAMTKKRNLLGNAFNFSYEKPTTVLDLVHTIFQRMNSSIKPKILRKANNEIRAQYMSSQKAKKMLGWKPKFTMDEGIDKTIQWYREYFKKKL